MRSLLYCWTRSYCMPPRWMAVAYYSVQRDKILFVAFPLNLLVAAAWWLQDRWARVANAPSWIDREADRRAALHRLVPY